MLTYAPRKCEGDYSPKEERMLPELAPASKRRLLLSAACPQTSVGMLN